METPFYEQWWFLLVMALSSLLVILLVGFSLLLHGQSKKYRNCGAGGEPPRGPGAEAPGFSLPVWGAHTTRTAGFPPEAGNGSSGHWRPAGSALAWAVCPLSSGP